jgi:hypothetical protein
VTLAGEELARKPLLALRTVESGGMWRRMVDHLKLMLE